MRNLPRYAALVALVLGACSDDVESTGLQDDALEDAPPADEADAATAVDATAVADASTDRYRCRGEALPTTAPATITIAGTTATFGSSAPVPRGGVRVEVFRTGQTSALASTTSANSTGAYSVSVSTGGTPIDGFARASVSGLLATEIYPAAPFAASSSTTNFVLLNQLQLNTIASFADVSRRANTAVLSLGVLDCDGRAIEGATVTVPNGVVVYTVDGRPDSEATATSGDGVALVFNVPAGTVEITTTDDNGDAMRVRRVNARGNVIAATSITP